MGIDESLVAKRFGKLVTTGLWFRNERSALMWEARCDCGTQKLFRADAVKAGRIDRCIRCRRYKVSKYPNGVDKHTYGVWQGMKNRCRAKEGPNVEHYVKRGIKVCERWDVYNNFLADMGVKPAGKSLDRINNDGNYEPSNCRWATNRQQALNRRNNRRIELRGETKTLTEWCEQFGITEQVFRKRFARGWSMERALTTPRLRNRKRKAT